MAFFSRRRKPRYEPISLILRLYLCILELRAGDHREHCGLSVFIKHANFSLLYLLILMLNDTGFYFLLKELEKFPFLCHSWIIDFSLYSVLCCSVVEINQKMGFWGQSGRRGGRSPGRVLGHLLDAQYGMAETVLGAVAVVLVVWLLWPEDPMQLHQQEAAWQPAAQDTEPRHVRLISKGSMDEKPGTSSANPATMPEDGTTPEQEASVEVGVRYSTIKPIRVSERRRIAKPSELADRLDSFGQRTEIRVFQPSPKRPSDLIVSSELETASESGGSESLADGPLAPSELSRATELADAALASPLSDGDDLELEDGSLSPAELARATELLETALASPLSDGDDLEPEDGSLSPAELSRATELLKAALASLPSGGAGLKLEDGPLSPSELARATEILEAALASPPSSDAGLEQRLDADEKPLDVATQSLEKPEAEPLPEVDLSDLDTLVPPGSAKPEATEQDLSTMAALTASPDGAIEPFDVQPDPTVPTTDVHSRPRDDAPTWLRNAVSVAVGDDRPMIAVVIDDLGLNRSNTAAFNSLPSPLTLSFLPYAGAIKAQTNAANSAGHELMLHMPMEPLGSNWPGPDALTTKIDQGEFMARLIKNLDRFDGFVGVNNHMGSRLTADRSRMDVVMHELRKRDVLFLDSKTSARSVASEAAGQSGVPNTGRDIFLDHVIDIKFIKRQLAATEKIAQQYGSAVAIGHPHGVTIQALRAWLPGLKARGFKLAPISAVVARRACRSNVLIAAETCGRYLQARSRGPSTLTSQGG